MLAVIKHYRDSSDMQQEAASFLIKHMYDHKGIHSTALDSIIIRMQEVNLSDKELENLWGKLQKNEYPKSGVKHMLIHALTMTTRRPRSRYT